MANRDFKKIERTIKDFSQNVGGSNGGGLILVDELPSVGKDDCLYKTPDGKIWSCVNKTEEKVISDLEVGKSYKLKESVKAKDIVTAVETLGKVNYYFSEEGRARKYPFLMVGAEDSPMVGYMGGPNVVFLYRTTNPITQEDIEVTIQGGQFDLPSIEITEYFVNQTKEKVHYISFLFEGGSHTETVTTCTWTEVGAESKLYTIQIRGEVSDGSDISVTTQVDEDNLSTYDDLCNYLMSKGYMFNYSSGSGSGFVLNASGMADEIITGIYINYDEIYLLGSHDSVVRDSLSIVYLNK